MQVAVADAVGLQRHGRHDVDATRLQHHVLVLQRSTLLHVFEDLRVDLIDVLEGLLACGLLGFGQLLAETLEPGPARRTRLRLLDRRSVGFGVLGGAGHDGPPFN